MSKVFEKQNRRHQISSTLQTEIQNNEASSKLISEISSVLKSKPFKPHPFFVNGHAQTFAGYLWPRRSGGKSHALDEERFFEVEKDVKLLAHCRWQENKQNNPTIILIHGLEGSSTSVYMISTASKAFHAGFNVVRLNMRTCGGTEHLTPTAYHSGMYGDFLQVINELIESDSLKRIFLAGFSMSANMALHLAGRLANELPDELKAICAISPAVDVASSIHNLHLPSNKIYHNRFLKSLRKRITVKHTLAPNVYDVSKLKNIKTIRDFDEHYTAPLGGFKNADDYYSRVSSFPVLKDIRKPTLIIHAQDDPFIPFHPLKEDSISSNPNIILIGTEHGGHVGFVAAKKQDDPDRFWMENRLIEFCSLVNERTSKSEVIA